MDKRTLLAVAISILILVAWSYFIPKNEAPVPTGPAEQTAPSPEEPLVTKKVPPPPPVKADIPAADARAADVVVETDLYRAVFSTKGAIVTSWELKNFKNSEGNPVSLLKQPGNVPPLSIIFEGPNGDVPQQLMYSANVRNITMSERDKRGRELVFTYTDNNITIIKRFVFYNDAYKIDFTVETVNTPAYTLPVGTGFGVYDTEQREHKGPVMLVGSDRKEFDEDDSAESFSENVNWIAQEDKYFTAALIPRTPVKSANVWVEGESAEIGFKLDQKRNDLLFYVGPKEYDRLKQLDVGLEHMIDFGWFAFIAMPLFWVLKFFYKIFGNYGWSIIVLTVIVRIPFIPIMHKSQKSMKKMQTIQPMMAELKEKYKDDSQKMQKEMMQLYKKHKVNPIGGCLPMFLQIPVFIALYHVLLKAIELRGAEFLYISDLAAKDPYYIMPIVMGLTMVIQQKMTPSAMDPKQAKMMMLMPIVFTFMFLTFPAGLVIYWLVNNVLGIAQQYVANKKAAEN